MASFSKLRDPIIQWEVKRRIQNATTAIKDMTNLEIDSKQKTFSVKLELAGESQPLTVTGNYRLNSENGKTSFAPADIQTSKEWLTILAAELIKRADF